MTAILCETLVGMIFRQVFTDGRPPAPVDVPTWLGYSTGLWEGDTFVVDSRGFRDGGWIDTAKGHPASDATHVIERFLRVDFGHMALTVTIDDPKAYVKDIGANTASADRRNWVIANQRFARVLIDKGYHYQFVYAKNAGHVDREVIRQTLPQALEYVWKGYPIAGK